MTAYSGVDGAYEIPLALTIVRTARLSAQDGGSRPHRRVRPGLPREMGGLSGTPKLLS